MNSDLFERKEIAIRCLYTLFFLLVFEILKFIVQLAVIFQYVFLFITKKYNNPVQVFSNKVSVYAYRVMRYMTLNENEIPFPFSEFPTEMESSDLEVKF